MRKLIVLALLAIVTVTSFAADARLASRALAKYDPPITVKVWRRDDNRAFVAGDKLTDNIWTREIESRLGIKFQYVWIAPTAEFNTKINSSLAAGDLPDILTGLNLEQYYSLARLGRLAPQNQLLLDYDVGDVRKYLDFGPGITRKMLTVNKEIYGWGIGPDFADVPIFTARGDWLENVGLKMPEKIDDIIDLLYAFKNRDPDKNGKNDTYGLAASQTFLEAGMPLYPFFACYDAYPSIWVEQGSNLLYGSLATECKTALGVLRKLYADGIMSKDFATLADWSDAPDEIAKGKVGALFANQWWHNWGPATQTVAKNPSMRWQHVFPKKANGQYISKPVSAQVQWICAVNSKFAYPEALLKIFNLNYALWVDPKTADSRFHTIQTADGGRVAAFFYWNDFMANIRIDANPRLALDVTAAFQGKLDPEKLNPEAKSYYDGAQSYLKDRARLVGNDTGYGNYMTFGPDGTNSTLAWIMINGNYYKVDAFQGLPTPSQVKYRGDLVSKRNEMYVKIITGQVDLEKGWQDWLAYWDKNGGREWTAEVNAWKQANK